MADNYLERRMEDYRSGRLRATSRGSKSATATPLPSSVAETLGPSTRILILTRSASASSRARALIGLMRMPGCRVAFTDINSAEGTRLAQATGAQCHPIDWTDEAALERSRGLIERRWGGIDVEVVVND
ncbi:MAG: SDR family oxidoreductase [Pseudoflavonifractor sp.]|nr:SDR family oxidoreductase [Alloprevotella sp.]MCM1116016.1 SDR family oxidoreductase [Pseudoflavonifractor sp.]